VSAAAPVIRCVDEPTDGALAKALELAAQGIPCFPCSTTKSPTTPHGFKDACRDQAAVRVLWERHPGRLIGVPSDGSSDLNVLDIDPRAGGYEWFTANRDRLPQTRVHRTRSGGLHLLFRHDASIKCSVGRIAPGVDVRASGGYVIWWPAAGFPVLNDAPSAAWPDWLFPPSRTQAIRAQRRVVVPDSAALNRLVQLVAGAQPGERNNLTFWAACRAGEMVLSGLLPARTAASVIAEAAIRAGLSPAEAERTVWSGIRSAGGPSNA
jgi:hypothetical protein